jgi:dihydroflavonol-4-reductase
MSETLLVTGATGSVGGNICRLAAEQGVSVRGLVRNIQAATPLETLGVTLVEGDVTDRDSLIRAAEGADIIIHAAAQIGGTWTTAKEADFEAVNQQGTFNALDAAQANDVQRIVLLLSGVIADQRFTMTEISPFRAISPENSPYARTKLAGMYEGLARAARGMDVNFVIPGGIYGPTPLIERALVPTIYTGTLVAAARGELTSYLPSRHSWVLASEVAAISLAAAEKGQRGARYLALGRAEDACSLPAFCNRFLEMAGIEHRVAEIDINDPAVMSEARFGSMVKYQQSTYPDPLHDCSVTTVELGIAPGSLDEGLRETLRWLRDHDKV